MAWTAPRTWVTAEVVTAAIMNTHVRDNLLETAPAKAVANGDLFYATGAGGVAILTIGSARKVLKSNGTLPQWTDGVEPASGYFMGAVGNDRHMESNSGSTTGSSVSFTYANAFAAAAAPTAISDQSQAVTITANSSTGCTIAIGGGANGTVHMIALGAD